MRNKRATSPSSTIASSQIVLARAWRHDPAGGRTASVSNA
jgi:hypothetical protein